MMMLFWVVALELVGQVLVGNHARRITRFQPADYEEATFPNYGGRVISRIELSDILELVRTSVNSLVLEVGMGTGRVLRPLSEQGSVVVGVDADPRMARYTRERFRKDGQLSRREVHFAVAEGEHLPFRPGVFDAVVCVRVLRYFERPWKAVAEMSHALRPGGRLVLEFANLLRPHALTQIPHFLAKREVYPHLFQRRSAESKIANLGLKIEAVRSWHEIPPGLLMSLNNPQAVRAVVELETVLKKISPIELMSRSFVLAAVKRFSENHDHWV